MLGRIAIDDWKLGEFCYLPLMFVVWMCVPTFSCIGVRMGLSGVGLAGHLHSHSLSFSFDNLLRVFLLCLHSPGEVGSQVAAALFVEEASVLVAVLADRGPADHEGRDGVELNGTV